MVGYIVADIEITDSNEYQKYAQQTAATLEPYGGKFLVRGGQPETLEGDWKSKRIVIIGIRHRSAVSNILIVRGA